MDRAVVAVIDDDPGMRKSLCMVLEQASLDVKTFESAEQYLAAHPGELRGCLVLDLRLEGMSGLELLEGLRARGVATPVIMISGHGDVSAAVHSMKLGAVDFLEKPIKPQDLIARVHAALAADGECCRKARQVESARQRLADLTARERELLAALAQGKSSKQIAREWDLSLRTVENHRAHLLSKSGAENVADLVRLSVLAGLA